MFGLRHRGSSTTGLEDLQVFAWKKILFKIKTEPLFSQLPEKNLFEDQNRTTFQPIAPVKGATLVEEEFMEEEKVKAEIYVYYMKTVGMYLGV